MAAKVATTTVSGGGGVDVNRKYAPLAFPFSGALAPSSSSLLIDASLENNISSTSTTVATTTSNDDNVFRKRVTKVVLDSDTTAAATAASQKESSESMEKDAVERSCHQGQTQVNGSIAALEKHRIIENDGACTAVEKQMAPIDHHHQQQQQQQSKGLTSLSHGTTTALSNVEFVDAKKEGDRKKQQESRRTFEDQLKPFNSIPGPWPSLPLIGTGWQYFYLVGRYDLNRLHEAHIDRYRSYGPIVREEYQWGRSIVHLYDPDDFEAVARAQGRCPVRPPNEFVSTLRQSKPDMYPNVGFANLNGPEWQRLRAKLAPAIMKLSTIHESMAGQNEVCDDFLEYLWAVRRPETNTVENLQEAAYRLALESICLMCLDSRIGSFPDSSPYDSGISDEDEEGEEEQNEAVKDGEKLIEATKLMFDSFNKLYYGLPFWKYFATSAYSSLDQAETTIYELASKYIDREMDLILNGEEHYDSNESVLKTLLKKTKADPKELSKEEVKVTIMDFIIGGIFSVSNSLVYLFYHLAANPDVQEKLYREIESVIGCSSTSFCSSPEDEDDQRSSAHHHLVKEHVTSGQLARMPYLKACVSESFRLNCPVPGIMRVTTEPMVLSGYHIPANTPVFSHCMTTCRLEEYFPQAERFWPERWTDPAQTQRNHPFALLPFGFGGRMCVGKRFSENEIYLATVRLLMAYRIELAGAENGRCRPLELRHAFMVIPANPISLRIIPR